MEGFSARVTLFILFAKVGQRNSNTLVEVSVLAQTVLQSFVFIRSNGEDAAVRPESLTCTCTVAFAYFLYGIQWFTARIFLLIYFAVTEYVGCHVGRKSVHT